MSVESTVHHRRYLNLFIIVAGHLNLTTGGHRHHVDPQTGCRWYHPDLLTQLRNHPTWEKTPLKVATVQFKTTPSLPKRISGDGEDW